MKPHSPTIPTAPEPIARIQNSVGVAFALGWAILYWWLDYPPVVVGGLLLTTATYIWYGFQLHRSPGRFSKLMRVPILTLWTSLLILSVFTGGIYSGAVIWMALVPLLTFVMLDEPMSFLLLGLTCLGLTGIAIAQSLNLLPVEYVPYRLLQHYLSDLTAAITVFSITLGYARVNTNAIRQIRLTNVALTSEVDDHRRTRCELERVQQELLNAAHSAGMAEVATGVLHNVGNGMNGVNVSATLISDRLDTRTPDRLEDVANLLQAGVMTAERQAKVARYIHELAEAQRQNHATVAEEISNLRSGIDHVKAIVQAQQSVARSAGHSAPITPQQAVDQALAPLQSSLEQLHIRVQTEIPDLRPLTLDPHKLLQVLSNLLTNARDALRDHTGERTLRVCVRETGPNVYVSVTDSGPGIAPENIGRIFEHGFTTKQTGHGFGLHISALAARNLGGALTVQSDGLGHGTTFTLRIERNVCSRGPIDVKDVA